MSGKPLFVAEETLQRALELRSQGLTIRGISNKVGVPRERLRKLLLAAGAPSNVPISLSLVSYHHVDPVWLAEFRGFFYGEGCATIAAQRDHQRSRPQYQPMIQVSLREDDADAIIDIHRHLGGNVTRFVRDKRTSQPAAKWQLAGFSRVTNLLPLLFEGMLPAKKRRDLQILHEMCQARLQMPYNLTDEHSQELGRYYKALRSIKRFQGTDG